MVTNSQEIDAYAEEDALRKAVSNLTVEEIGNLTAQSTKSSVIAFWLGAFLSGCGHLYLGLKNKAMQIFLIALFCFFCGCCHPVFFIPWFLVRCYSAFSVFHDADIVRRRAAYMLKMCYQEQKNNQKN